VELSALRRIARHADGWMTNQIELPLLKDHVKRLREMLAKMVEIPTSSKLFCTTASV
jgi:alkanesulfonate monooxygenase SsuD/methylene tetrahydromethanopterin reductase-like flavin-dependent oxidoreductase (luciferase family)